ncbi:MAG: hypothetical protein RL607_1711 [Bacteroidota bacterium]
MTTKTDLFFDLDHTLWDFERNSALAFEKLLSRHSIAVPLADFLTHYIPLNKWYWEKYRKDEVTQAELRYGRLKTTFDRLNIAISDDLIDQLSEEYILELPLNNHLYEGSIDLLTYLQPKYRLHIITNGFQSVQDGKLKNSGIGEFFHSITNSETAGVKKPHPLIFEKALEKAGTIAQHSVMIGDCLEADVQGALDAGMDAIFFNEFEVEVPQGITAVTHLSQLKNIF